MTRVKPSKSDTIQGRDRRVLVKVVESLLLCAITVALRPDNCVSPAKHGPLIGSADGGSETEER